MSVPGFVGKRPPADQLHPKVYEWECAQRGGWALPAPDPNADLIGYTFETELGTAVVLGSSPYDSAYLLIDTEAAGQSVRAAAQVRRHKEIACQP